MSLPDSKMNSVLQISSKVFGRRAEESLKGSGDVACVPDMDDINLTNIVFELREYHFRKIDNEVFFVIGLGLRANYAGGSIDTTASALLRVLAETSNLTITPSIEYDRTEFAVPLPPDVRQRIDDEIRARIQPTTFPVPLNEAFGENMTIVGEAELTVVGGTDNFSPVLAIGLEINEGETVDRGHFRDNYSNNLLQDENEDWALQIESNLMHIKLSEEYGEMDFSTIIDLPDDFWWKRTDWKKTCWCGECLDWDYHGWKEYINDNYWRYPAWLAGAAVIRYVGFGPDFDIPFYWLAYADIIIENEDILIDPYIFELDARNWMGALPFSIERDLPRRRIGSARVSQDFLMTRRGFSVEDFTVYGIDEREGIPGTPHIDVSHEHVHVNYGIRIDSYTGGRGLIMCTAASNIGELVNDRVVSHFDISNQGDGPLWICQVAIDIDPDNVFSVQLPAGTPLLIEPNDSVTVDVFLDVPEGEDINHEGSISVRSNDFNRPSYPISISGIRKATIDGAISNCHETPDSINPSVLQTIYELVIVPVQEDLETFFYTDYPIPPIGDEDPPCPECGYFLDVTLPMLSENVIFGAKNDTGQVIEQSRSFKNVHFFSLPLPPSEKAQIFMSPEEGKGGGIIKLGISRVIREGMYRTEKKIKQLASDGSLIFALHEEGIDIVNIANPKKPYLTEMMRLEKVKSIMIHDGYLYALVNKALEIYDINDPYSTYVFHKIPVHEEAGAHILEDHLALYDSEKLRIYQLNRGITPKWIGELKPKEKINQLIVMPNNYLLSVNGGMYVFDSLDVKELSTVKLTKIEEIKKKIPSFEIKEDKEMLNGNLVLYDEFHLKILETKKGFAIFKKDIIPYIFRRKLIEGIRSLKRDCMHRKEGVKI